ncbi:hypothetical protein CYMTET_25050 [Cymbomonas tetramitiformis]|uniref:CAP-Gly domain-containing protein n=1 Tax=Cymbomonas tetramitiformis TaxID=36881 RepID=A0AAE0KZC1_9CHLO|nr:hypothetical protein CYMTET_25050 [Cymbomonas tetramitiformis]
MPGDKGDEWEDEAGALSREDIDSARDALRNIPEEDDERADKWGGDQEEMSNGSRANEEWSAGGIMRVDEGLSREALLDALALCGRMYQRGRLSELGQLLANFVDPLSVHMPKHCPFQLGDKVVVGKNRRLEGMIRYFGEVIFAPGDWVGIELEQPEGRNDGSVQGITYFTCPPNCGLFVRASILQPESPTAKDRLAGS